MNEYRRLRQAVRESEASRKRAQRWAGLLSNAFLVLASIVLVVGLTFAAAVYGPLIGVQLPLEQLGPLGELAASIAPTSEAATKSGMGSSAAMATLSLPTPIPSATPSRTATATNTGTATHTPLPTDTATTTLTPSHTPPSSHTPTSTSTLSETELAQITATIPTTATPTARQFRGCEYSGNPDFERALLTLINDERESQGLAMFTQDSRLRAAARVHAADMACNHFLSHTGSDGSSVGDRITVQGYAWTLADESILGFGDNSESAPDLAFAYWMAGASQRQNLLSSEFIEIGIGYVYSPDSPFGSYFTAVFARP